MCWATATCAAIGCGTSPPDERPPTPVQVEEARRIAVRQPLRYAASVEPVRTVELAFQAAGYITALAQVGGRPVEAGDRVKNGTTLAWVRAEAYDERLKQSQASLAEAEAARRSAAQALARAETLYGLRSLTKPELEQAQAAVDAIDARIAGARALMRGAEIARGDASLRAPMSGVVLSRRVEIGSLVGPGTSAFTLAETTTVKVVIAVPDIMLPRFRPGATTSVISEALPDRRFIGRVSRIAPAADARSRLFEIELLVDNRDEVLRPGMIASVHVGDEPDDGAGLPAVPLSAVTRVLGHADQYAVLVVDSSSGVPTARRRGVRLGALVGNRVAVIEGLHDGELVIVQGGTLVADGERVNPTADGVVR